MTYRFFTPAEMNEVSDACAVLDERIGYAVGEDSEMVEGGYVADLTSGQLNTLAARGLPTGIAFRRERTDA